MILADISSLEAILHFITSITNKNVDELTEDDIAIVPSVVISIRDCYSALNEEFHE